MDAQPQRDDSQLQYWGLEDIPAAGTPTTALIPSARPQVSAPARGFGPTTRTPHNLGQSAQLAQLFESLFGRISTRLGPSNPRWGTFSGELSPERITGAIDQCNAGIPYLLQDMYRRAIENDAHLGAVVAQKDAGIIAADDRFEPTPSMTRDEAAISLSHWFRAVRDQVDNFDDSRFSLLWADGAAYSSCENVYDFRRVIWRDAKNNRINRVYLVPVKLEVVDGRAYRFDTETDEPYLWLDGDYVTLPRGKFVFHRAYGYHSLTERRGYMRSCLYLHAMKQWGLRDLATFLHLYGIPQMVLEYDGNKYDMEVIKQIATQVREQFGQGGIPALPVGMIGLRNDSPPPSGALVHSQAVDFLNAQMTSRVTLGPLVMDQGAGYGIADVHAGKAFAGQVLSLQGLCASIREGLWRPTLDLNAVRLAQDLGVSPDELRASLPMYTGRLQREDSPETRQKIYSQAMRDGLPCSRSQYRADLHLDTPKDDADVLKGEAISVPSAGAVVGATEASEGAEAPPVGGAAPAATNPAGKTAPAGAAPSVDLTATAQAAVITVNEARAAMKLGPLEGDDGEMTVAEFMAKNATTISDASQAEKGSDSPAPMQRRRNKRHR